jgi:hypothetical protein
MLGKSAVSSVSGMQESCGYGLAQDTKHASEKTSKISIYESVPQTDTGDQVE